MVLPSVAINGAHMKNCGWSSQNGLLGGASVQHIKAETSSFRSHVAHRRNSSVLHSRCSGSPVEDPLLVRAARSEEISRPPAWMMRQAGRYMANYRQLSKKHPSFRERSETTDLIVEISLQPWIAFKPDGVILFSDILTPLNAMGIPFEIDENKGPIIESPIRSDDAFSKLHDIDFSMVSFVDESLRILRSEVGAGAAVLGFVGSPWTLATYCIEGGSTRTYTVIKSMLYTAPVVVDRLLKFLANQIAAYSIFQIEAGAQCIQLFDSWGGQLTPEDWETWSKPYLQTIVRAIKVAHPKVPVVLYANGSGGLLERMKSVGSDVIGLDWTIDMADGRARLGSDVAVQGNVDPAVLFATPDAITLAINRCVEKAGPTGHILNLGHGVLVGTPEESVAHFFDTVKSLSYPKLVGVSN